jgi:hypothetical protein
VWGKGQAGVVRCGIELGWGQQTAAALCGPIVPAGQQGRLPARPSPPPPPQYLHEAQAAPLAWGLDPGQMHLRRVGGSG